MPRRALRAPRGMDQLPPGGRSERAAAQRPRGANIRGLHYGWALLSLGLWRCCPTISHRRLDPILLGRHAGGGETAVGLFRRDGDDRSTWFQQACIAWRKCDDRRVWRDDDFRLAPLIG